MAFCEGRKSGQKDTGDINMLVKRSDDGGSSWNEQQVIWDDDGNTCGKTWVGSKLLNEGPSAYSDLAILPNGNIACLYERGDEHPYEKITLASFDLSWLTDGGDGRLE